MTDPHTPGDGRWDLQIKPEPNGVIVYLGRNWIAAALVAAVLLAVVVAA